MKIPKGLLLVLTLTVGFTAGSALAQTTSNQPVNPPSDPEVRELLNKANEKVTQFEATIKVAKPTLDKADSQNPKRSANYLDAASTAHTLIEGMQKNGWSAYGLVALLATLDDLSQDAANATVLLLLDDESAISSGKPQGAERMTYALALQGTQTACSDIAELLMHATLRVVQSEELALVKLLSDTAAQQPKGAR